MSKRLSSLAYSLLSHWLKAHDSKKSKLTQGGRKNEKNYPNRNKYSDNGDYRFIKHRIG
jgi:hypothetical protein